MGALTLLCPFCKKPCNCPETVSEVERIVGRFSVKETHMEYTCSGCQTVMASGDTIEKKEHKV